MQQWKSPHGLMVRCWCWTETDEGRVDNGWRPANKPYPHADVTHYPERETLEDKVRAEKVRTDAKYAARAAERERKRQRN